MTGPGRPKGLPKSPGTGRKKGTPNKRTLELREELVRFLGRNKLDHPVLYMLKIGHGLVTTPTLVKSATGQATVIQLPASIETRVTCLKEAAQYMEAKRLALRFENKAGDDIVPPMWDFSTLPKVRTAGGRLTVQIDRKQPPKPARRPAPRI